MSNVLELGLLKSELAYQASYTMWILSHHLKMVKLQQINTCSTLLIHPVQSDIIHSLFPFIKHIP